MVGGFDPRFGFRFLVFGFRFPGFGVSSWGFELGFRVSGFGLRASGFGLRVSGFRFQVSGFGYRAYVMKGDGTRCVPVIAVTWLRVESWGLRVQGSGFRD